MVVNKKKIVYALIFVIMLILFPVVYFELKHLEPSKPAPSEFHLHRQERLMQRAMTYCHSRCPYVCNDVNMVSFCLTHTGKALPPFEFLDLNLNMKIDGDNTSLDGIYVCEDAIPCYALVSECCNMTVNHHTCKDALDKHFTSKFEPEEIRNILKELIPKGSCDENTSPLHWYYDASFDEIFE